MEKDFLSYYSNNLAFLRKIGAEFAKEFPGIASSLGLDTLECQDPFVERLLEGSAFLSARIEKSLDQSYLKFLESILYSISPNVVAPIPALCNARISSSTVAKLGGINKVLPLGLQFSKVLESSKNEVVFENFSVVRVSPLRVKQVRHLSHDSEIASLTSQGYRQAIEIELETEGSCELQDINIPFLDFFINFPEQDASLLCEYFFSHLSKVYLKLPNGSYRHLPKVNVEQSLFAEEENIFTRYMPCVRGISNLCLFMAYPELMKYLRIRGLDNAFSHLNARSCSLVFIFNDESDFKFSNFSQEDSLLLNVVPLVNLFSQRSSRHLVDHNYEVNLNVDTSNQLNYEVYYVSKVDFFDEKNQPLFSAYPFFTARASNPDNSDNQFCQNFFTINRHPRQGGYYRSQLNAYRKFEAFISFSGDDFTKYQDKQLQFSAMCLATNVDWATKIQVHDQLKAKIYSELGNLDVITAITPPRNPLVLASDADDFKRLSYILCNFNSTFASRSDSLLFNLREIITLFSVRSKQETARLRESIRNTKVESQVFRFISRGVVYFESGYHIKLTFRRKELEGIGFYYLSKVLVMLITTYRNINVPIKIDVYSEERGYVYTCNSFGN